MEIKGSKGIFVGGASGMCLATAESFVQAGGKIAVLDLPTSAGAEVAARLGGTFHPVSVMDYEATEQAMRAAATALGGLHFVVNTAGGGVANQPVCEAQATTGASRDDEPCKTPTNTGDRDRIEPSQLGQVERAETRTREGQQAEDRCYFARVCSIDPVAQRGDQPLLAVGKLGGRDRQ